MSKNSFTKQTLGEEISNAISHGVGAFLSIAGLVVLVVAAYRSNSGALGITSAALYGASLVILYTFSCLYHSLADNRAKRVFRVFDHCSIFLLILGTYIPVCLTMIGGSLGWVLFGINCTCAVIGIVFNSIDLNRWEKVSMALYVLMGWSAVFSIKPLMNAISFNKFLILLCGGIAYTLGIFFYKTKRFRYAHFIWHLFVLAGSTIQYLFILDYYML